MVEGDVAGAWAWMTAHHVILKVIGAISASLIAAYTILELFLYGHSAVCQHSERF